MFRGPYKVHAPYTPAQAEVLEFGPKISFLAFGTVRKCLDDEHSGRLLVDCPAFPDGDEPCDYVSPIGGAGYGFFAIPGIGATVLVGSVPYSDPPNKFFWMGCLYAPGQEVQQDMKTQPYYRGKKDEQFNQITRTEILEDGDNMLKETESTYGCPNADHAEVYGSNDLPDSFILKHPGGHCISLTDKRADVEINEIKLKSAQNKRIVLSDARPDAGGERIQLIDENKNTICIRSEDPDNRDSIYTYAQENIEVTSKKGKMEHLIQEGDRDFSIDNKGSGDITVEAHQGEVVVKSPTKIRFECGGSYIELTPNKIEIKTTQMDQRSGFGDVLVQGVSLRNHYHIVDTPSLLTPLPKTLLPIPTGV